MALAWKGEGNSTSGLEACDVRANGFDCASTIRTWNDAVFYRKWIFSFGNDEVTEIQRYSVDCCALAMDDDQQGQGKRTLDKDIFVANLWDWCLLIQFERVKAGLPFHGPLLCCGWCHSEKFESLKSLKI